MQATPRVTRMLVGTRWSRRRTSAKRCTALLDGRSYKRSLDGVPGDQIHVAHQVVPPQQRSQLGRLRGHAISGVAHCISIQASQLGPCPIHGPVIQAIICSE